MGGRRFMDAAPPVLVIVAGTGNPGGTVTVSVWVIDRGTSLGRERETSSQTTPTPEPGTVTVGVPGSAISVVDAASASPSRRAIERRAWSLTVTDETVTGTLKPFVNESS
jgi:hypothetical protein